MKHSKGLNAAWNERIERVSRVVWGAVAWAGVVGGGAGAARGAFLPAQSLDGLSSDAALIIPGMTNTTTLGESALIVEDMNGDGLREIALGALRDFVGDPAPNGGSVWVIFGRTNWTSPVDLSGLNGANGFRVRGTTNEYLGSRLASGDFNGDGLGDLAVTAQNGVGEDTSATDGRVYLVFGQSNAFSAVVASTGIPALLAPTNAQGFGFFLRGVGDFNGDGRDDLALGDPSFDLGSLNEVGRVLVVLGRDTFPATLPVSSLGGADGFQVRGFEEDGSLGYGIGALGDFDGDGLEDMCIGAPYAGSSTLGQPFGKGYVVLGASNPPPVVSVGELTGANGFSLNGESGAVVATEGFLGYASSGAGDFNGDGQSDLIVTAPGASAFYGGFNGRAYVLLGSGDLGPLGYQLDTLMPDEVAIFNGGYLGDAAGLSVAGGGDFNGDGIDDVAIGAPGLFAGPSAVGRVHVVFGQSEPWANPFSLLALDGNNGTTYLAATNFDQTGVVIGGMADVNEDGAVDLLVTSPGYGGSAPGTAYLIWGQPPSGGVTGSATAGAGTGGGTGATAGSGTTGGTGAASGSTGGGTGGGATAGTGSGGVTGAGGTGIGGTGGGTNAVTLLDWAIELKRPKAGKAVTFKGGTKGLGTVKGTVSDIELDSKSEGVQVELALVVPQSGTNGTGETAVVFEEASKVSKVNKKGRVKFSAKKLGADAALESGQTIELLVRATEPETTFETKSTPIQTNTFEVK